MARCTKQKTEKLEAQVAALQDEVADLKEQLEVAVGLERIASSAEKAAQQDVQRMQDEIGRLKAENYRLRSSAQHAAVVEEKPAERGLASYDDLEDWADEVLGPHIFIHNKAIRECRKNGHSEQFRMYYAWDEDGRRLIIGKMPSHLPNDMS